MLTKLNGPLNWPRHLSDEVNIRSRLKRGADYMLYMSLWSERTPKGHIQVHKMTGS